MDLSRVALKDGATVEADLKQEENNVMFREDLHSHNERKEQMEDNMQWACALTMNDCCWDVLGKMCFLHGKSVLFQHCICV